MNLTAMTSSELLQHAEIYAQTELERCLVAAVAKARDEAEAADSEEVEQLQQEVDDLELDLHLARRDLSRSADLLRRIADGDEAALAECRESYGTKTAHGHRLLVSISPE